MTTVIELTKKDALRKEAKGILQRENIVLRALYVGALKMAKEVVDEALVEEKETLRNAAILAVFEKIGCTRNDFLDEIRLRRSMKPEHTKER